MAIAGTDMRRHGSAGATLRDCLSSIESNGEKTMTETNGERPVVICTKYRGVFFGYATDTTSHTVTLKRSRMCVYWGKSLHGVLGLASDGPNGECRIGPAVEQIELRGVTAVIEMTPGAVEAWENAPWS